MKTRRQVFAESAERNRIADATPEFCTANRLVTDQNGKTGRAFSLGKYPARHDGPERRGVPKNETALRVRTQDSESGVQTPLHRGLR
ncbi:MAG: hypothetical protein KBS45_04115 [Clostridiales bacterium]|nr:hypothetical protein [Candidatus Coliplasma caballi]